MKPKVAVVIPNWNGADFIGKCLESLINQTLKARIVVVENGSDDDSVSIIKHFEPDVELLAFPDNAGFAGGVNRGIQSVINEVDFVALFNNDALANPNWLKHLVAAAQNHPEAGIITGKFLRMDKKHLDSTGDLYSTHAMPFPRGRNQKDTGQYDTAEYVFGATGGASLYRTSMLKEVGLSFDSFGYGDVF